ncbi:MurR/RpiR family transcriptional regulator [Clostridium sp. AN503]|uniref:MurR/RpiR family transcriptional regulator n=1 Tax=Clostridium sp. AN503 TaxID=3160598 RepID=UPI003459EDB9
MQPNILDEISNQHNTMTRSAKKLADYIFSNKSMVQYMSITSLAEASGVSEATITRFCRSLGLGGYNEFKLAIARADQSAHHLSPLSAETEGADENSIESLCRRLYHTDVTALTETLELMNPESAHKAVDLLSQAQRIYCFGQGGSNIMAKEAWVRFSTASSKFLHIEDSHMQAMAASLCTSEDVILFFSYSGSTRDMLDVLRPAKNGGASIILITHFFNSPAAVLSDVVLLCGATESPLQSGSIAARIGQLFIIDYLFHTYCIQNQDLCARASEATAQATARKLL